MAAASSTARRATRRYLLGSTVLPTLSRTLLYLPTTSIAGPADAISWSVGASPAASHIGIRSRTSFRTSASTRLARRAARPVGAGRQAMVRVVTMLLNPTFAPLFFFFWWAHTPQPL